MKDRNCAYCMREERGELLDAFGIFICELRDRKSTRLNTSHIH